MSPISPPLGCSLRDLVSRLGDGPYGASNALLSGLTKSTDHPSITAHEETHKADSHADFLGAPNIQVIV